MSLIVAKPAIQRFVLGGNAVFTVENRFSGGRFTYKVRQKKNGDIFWVSLLNGPDNTKDFRFLGTVFPANGVDRHTQPPNFRYSPKGNIGQDAPSVKAWTWFFKRLFSSQEFPLGFEFYHSNHCGRCGRFLTTPESSTSGFGPDCREMMGF